MSTFDIGNRVEYTDVTKMQLGTERTCEQGTVVDMIIGQDELVQLVFTQPDNPVAVLEPGQKLRLDYVMAHETVLKVVPQ